MVNTPSVMRSPASYQRPPTSSVIFTTCEKLPNPSPMLIGMPRKNSRKRSVACVRLKEVWKDEPIGMPKRFGGTVWRSEVPSPVLGDLAGAVAHFCEVTASYWESLVQ